MSCSRLIAIGDIHGCSMALAAMIEKIAPTPEDMIVTLGDYVGRGIDPILFTPCASGVWIDARF